MAKEKQKGVTLVETVISMALIAIVTAAIFATSNFTISSQEKNKQKHFFENETENVLMCYYSNSFSSALKFLTGDNEILVDSESNDYTLYYNENFEYVAEELAVYSLKIDYTNIKTPTVVCKNIDSNIEIYSYGGEDNEE